MTVTAAKKAKWSQFRSLRTVKPREWKQRISKLQPPEVRPVVGRIVWWDFFGDRTVADRVDEFDPWLKFDRTDAPAAAIRKGLLAIGYPEHRATQRIAAFK